MIDKVKEIQSLLHLIDDPDEEVFKVVSDRILSHGSALIPPLEALWEDSYQSAIQKRIEILIHRLKFRQIQNDFEDWAANDEPDLLTGFLLVSKLEYPDLSEMEIEMAIEKLRRNVWLELNNYLTPLEQIHILSSILYNFYRLEGGEVNYDLPFQFYLNKVLDSKNGNTISNGLLYTILADLLGIPVKVLNIPQHFLLGYFRTQDDFLFQPSSDRLPEFFIDPTTGSAFTQQEVEEYFERNHIMPLKEHFQPVPPKAAIRVLLLELSKCYQNSTDFYKYEELQLLAHLAQSHK